MTELELGRLRRKLHKLSGADAFLPSGLELHEARCPSSEMLLDFFNRSMPRDERPKVSERARARPAHRAGP